MIIAMMSAIWCDDDEEGGERIIKIMKFEWIEKYFHCTNKKIKIFIYSKATLLNILVCMLSLFVE